MNYDECLRQTINSSLGDVLEQMKSLEAEDRYNLLCEWAEFLFYDYETDEILMVPQIEKEESK